MQEVKALHTKTLGIEEGKQIESYLSNAGKLKAKLSSPLMLRYLLDSAKIEFPKTLHVDFYDSLTTIESKLDAKYGRYLENDNKVFLKDSIVFFSRKGDTLWCNELYWDQYKGTFYTDKPAIVAQTNPRQKIYAAKGLIADQNFKWFTLNSVGKIYTGKENFINVPDSTSY
ncbi:MAG: LPS export ABC transporter periplasmic protein LptC [Chitinophagaceae bacterium]